MKTNDLDKLLFDHCRKQDREKSPRDTSEPVDYYLLSKFIEGKATEKEKTLVADMITRDPSLAELLEPIEELNADITVEQYAKPVKVQPRWLPRVLRLAACLAVIITGSFWLMTVANSPDDEIVVRSVKECPATNIADHTTNRVHKTETEN